MARLPVAVVVDTEMAVIPVPARQVPFTMSRAIPAVTELTFQGITRLIRIAPNSITTPQKATSILGPENPARSHPMQPLRALTIRAATIGARPASHRGPVLISH